MVATSDFARLFVDKAGQIVGNHGLPVRRKRRHMICGDVGFELQIGAWG